MYSQDNPLNFLDIRRDDTAFHDPCRLEVYLFDTYDGPVEVLAYTESDAIRRAEELGFDVLAIHCEVMS